MLLEADQQTAGPANPADLGFSNYCATPHFATPGKNNIAFLEPMALKRSCHFGIYRDLKIWHDPSGDDIGGIDYRDTIIHVFVGVKL